MKKIIILLLFVPIIANAQIDQLKNILKIKVPVITNLAIIPDISAGLKEALNNGITKQVSKLTAEDGFYKNDLVKIVLPTELQKVDKTLRSLGMSSLADEGLKLLNRAAEDAVKEATPIFVDAVKNMTFTDAKTILMGKENSATTYLEIATSTALYDKFSPLIATSLDKVNADKIWGQMINKYNSIPLVKKVSPNLKDYVTKETMKGVFKMVAVEEKEIRVNLKARTSPLLQSIFAMQDKK
ncbi:MAG: DUF4197 domain-containing protein [Flavobacteriaceae bacterium]|nr:DUF4197 domain-containing protein [Flavobacteriaceae bacterium]